MNTPVSLLCWEIFFNNLRCLLFSFVHYIIISDYENRQIPKDPCSVAILANPGSRSVEDAGHYEDNREGEGTGTDENPGATQNAGANQNNRAGEGAGGPGE
jgi:hypothetical protein